MNGRSRDRQAVADEAVKQWVPEHTQASELPALTGIDALDIYRQRLGTNTCRGPEDALLALLFEAHDKAARRANISTAAAQNAFIGSGSYTNAIASALLTLGGMHGPIVDAYHFLQSSGELAYDIMHMAALGGPRLPGWGHGFHKGIWDPDFAEVQALLRVEWKELAEKMTLATDFLHSKGKNLYPNPACYTAAAAIALGLPARLAPFLFVAGRLAAWTEMLGEVSREGAKEAKGRL